MQSRAATVAQYLSELPPERRSAIEALRRVILANLDKDYEEAMCYGMISYVIPHRVYPAGYHCNPDLPVTFAAVASQKQHLSLYLMGVYCGCIDGQESDHARWFRAAWTATGKKLDMGKACVRFKRIEDVPLEVVGEAIRRVPAKTYLAMYEEILARTRKPRSAREPATRKPPAKEPAARAAAHAGVKAARKAPRRAPRATKR